MGSLFVKWFFVCWLLGKRILMGRFLVRWLLVSWLFMKGFLRNWFFMLLVFTCSFILMQWLFVLRGGMIVSLRHFRSLNRVFIGSIRLPFGLLMLFGGLNMWRRFVGLLLFMSLRSSWWKLLRRLLVFFSFSLSVGLFWLSSWHLPIAVDHAIHTLDPLIVQTDGLVMINQGRLSASTHVSYSQVSILHVNKIFPIFTRGVQGWERPYSTVNLW